MWKESAAHADDSSRRTLGRVLEWIERFEVGELSVGDVAQNLGVIATALESVIPQYIRDEVDSVAGDLEVAALTMDQHAQRSYGHHQLQELARHIREFLDKTPVN